MVLAAMAEHDFAPSWLKIPSDQQKRGQKLGAPDQWSSGNNGNHHHHDDGSRGGGRHRHYSSSDSSHPPSSGGYGMSPSMGSSSVGPPQGGYGYSRGREPDRRNYPRPGSGSRHHSVDDLNGYHDYGAGGGGWNMPSSPQYGNGYYAGNFPRRGGSSPGVRDNLHFGGGGNQHGYGDVFQGGRGGYYNSNGGGRGGGGRGGGTGRQRYNSGSRSNYDDRDGQQKDGGSSSHGGDEGHKDTTAKKEGGKEEAKHSALFSNDFPSLLGGNSKSNSTKDAAKTNTPAGAWDKPPGAPKVQISGRKVQLIKKSIHNDLPPRVADPSTNSSTKSSTKSPSSSSVFISEESKVGGGQVGSSPRGSRPLSGGSSTVASSNISSSGGGSGMYNKPSTKAHSTSPKSPRETKDDTSALIPSKLSPKPSTPSSTAHPSKLSTTPSKPTIDIPTKPSPSNPEAQSYRRDDKKPLSNNIGALGNNKNTVGKFDSAKASVPKELVESKAGPSYQTQANRNSARTSAKVLTSKSIAGTTKTGSKSVVNQPIGKQSPTKPILVAKSIVQKQAPKIVAKSSSTKPMLVASSTIHQEPVSKPSQIKPEIAATTVTEKPVVKLVSKESPTKPIHVATVTNSKPSPKQLGGKESPTKPILVDISSTSKPTLKPMSVKNTNGKPALKESPVRPLPVQIKSAKLTGKESPNRPFPARTPVQKQQGGRDRSVRPGPVQIKSTRVTMKDAPIRTMPVNTMTRKPAAKDNPSSVAMQQTTHSSPSSTLFSSSKGNMMQVTSAPVNTISTLAKEPSINTITSPSSKDVRKSRFAINKNVNNSDHHHHHAKDAFKGLQNGGDTWSLMQHRNNGPLRIEDAGRMGNGPQHSTQNEFEVVVNSTTSTESTKHITTNGLDNDLCHTERNNLELSSSLEAEKRLLQEMGWHEHSDNEEGYAPITEDEMKEFQRRSQQLKRNGITPRSLPATFMSSSLPSTPVTSIDLDDALSSCSSDSSDDDL